MSKPTRSYSALLIEADVSAKMRLRTALQALPFFKRISSCLTFTEAETRFAEPYDVVFISSRLGSKECGEFVQRSKSSKHGQDSAFVGVLQASDRNNTAAAQSVLSGVDGVLCEPFSVDALGEIVEIAETVKKERARDRERVAIGLLVREIASQLDAITTNRMQGGQALISMKALKETCGVLQSLDPELQQFYFDELARVCEQARPPRTVAYRGASQRVKQRMSSKAMQKPDLVKAAG